MSVRKDNGNLAEKFIISRIPCPSCGKALVELPPNFPLFDVQCSGCHFRAQVKHSNSKPGNGVSGGGWDIMHKNMKSGHLIPPMFVYYPNASTPTVYFYPFLAAENVQKAKKALPSRPNYFMCKFVGLNDLPRFEYEF